MTAEMQQNTIIVKVSVLGAPQEGIGSAEVSLPMGVEGVSRSSVDQVQQAVKNATHEATGDLLRQILRAVLEGSGPADTP